MRHIFIALLTVTFLVTSGCSQVFAQDTTTSSGTIKERREAVASKAAERKALVKDRIAEHKEKMATRAAALKERVAAFKDKRKAAIVERVSENLNKINEKATAAMDQHLARMSELLAKLVDRVASKGTEGKDTTQADAAIASASAAIDTAQAAVDAQKLKDYTVSVSSESGVRADAKDARGALHTDLQVVRKLVSDAKQAIAAAIRTAATTLGGIGDGSK